VKGFCKLYVVNNINFLILYSECFEEMEELAEHGVSLPYNMQGLTDEQIEELKLKDEWAEKCVPSGGSVFKKDEIGRRNGHGKSIINICCFPCRYR